MKVSGIVLGALLILTPLAAYANSRGAATERNLPPTAVLQPATENATATSDSRPLRRKTEELRERNEERQTVRKTHRHTVDAAKATAKADAKASRRVISASRNKVSESHRSERHAHKPSAKHRLKQKHEKT